MSGNKVEHSSRNVKAVISLSSWQCVVTLLFAALMYVLVDAKTAWSALAGGLVCSAANMFFAGRLWTTKDDLQAGKIVRRFYRSESLKILFTLSMFVICMIIFKVALLPFIIAYLLAAVVVNWVYLLVSA